MDSSNVVDTFEQIDANADKYEMVPAGKLPGFGQKRDDCGDVVPHFCDGCGKPQDVGRTCYQWDCPRCAPAAAYRRTVTAASKIESYRQQKTMERDGHSPKFHHLTITFKEHRPFRATDPQDLIFEVSKAMMDDLGVMGGILIQHDYRGEGDEEDDRGKWKERLFSGRSWEDVESELSHEPHIHAIVIADYIDGNACKAIWEDTDGVVVNRITQKEHPTVSLFDKEDLAGAISYALSHVSIDDDNNAQYRYFGEVANHSAGKSVEKMIKGITRSVVPNTLDLNTAPLHCDSEYGGDVVEDDEYDLGGEPTPHSDSNGSEPDSGGSKDTYHCRGKMRHISYAEYVLDDKNLLFEAELRDAYQDWDPPPDDS